MDNLPKALIKSYLQFRTKLPSKSEEITLHKPERHYVSSTQCIAPSDKRGGILRTRECLELLVRVEVVDLLRDISVGNIRTVKRLELDHRLIHIALLLISSAKLIKDVLLLVSHTGDF